MSKTFFKLSHLFKFNINFNSSIYICLSVSRSKVSGRSPRWLPAPAADVLHIRCSSSPSVAAGAGCYSYKDIAPLRKIIRLYDVLIHTLIYLSSWSVKILASLVLHRGVNSLTRRVVYRWGAFYLVDIGHLDKHAHLPYELLHALLCLLKFVLQIGILAFQLV